MIIICCGVESALAHATSGMNIHTADYLNGSTFVSAYLPGINNAGFRDLPKTTSSRTWLVERSPTLIVAMSLNQPKTATIAYIAIAPKMMQRTTDLLRGNNHVILRFVQEDVLVNESLSLYIHFYR